jgi:hypothetical protein
MRQLLYLQQRQEHFKQAEAIYEFRKNRLVQKLGEYEQIDPGFRSRIDPELARTLTWTTPDPNQPGGIAYGTTLGDLVMDADEVNPAELMVYFSQHKDVYQRIAALHPLKQGVALGEIVGRLAAAKTGTPRPSVKPHVISTASPPIKPPVASSLTSDDELDDADDLSEAAVNRHIRRENARMLKHPTLRRLR